MTNTEEYFDDVLEYIENSKVDKLEAPLTWYRVKSEFNLPIGRISGFTTEGNHWTIKEDETIAFGSIPYQDTDRRIKRINIAVREHDEEIQLIESARKFFDINHKIFENITLQVQRDNKINKLI